MFTYVARPTRSAPCRACNAISYCIFFRKMSDIHHTTQSYHIVRKKSVVFGQFFTHVWDKCLYIFLKIFIDIKHDAANHILVDNQTTATCFFKNLKNNFSLAHSVNKCSCCTQIVGVSCPCQAVGIDTIQLIHNGANVLRSQRNFNFRSLFNAHAQGMAIHIGRKIIQTIGKV